MFEQLNFIEDMERAKKEQDWFEKRTSAYNKWLSLPNETHISDGSEERSQVRYDFWQFGLSLYRNAHHICEPMPEDEYVWLNSAASHSGGEFWVLNKKDGMGGKHIEVCPYCGANLAEGRGDVLLQKKEEGHWRMYLYYEVPKHEGREPTRFEKLMSIHDRNTIEEVKEIYKEELMSAQLENQYKVVPSTDYVR
jgi:hypothetical protein